MAPPSFSLTPAGSHGVQPRQWQRQLIQLLRARVVQRQPGPQARPEDVLVHAGPGAGKTLGALLGFAQLQRERRLDHFVIFCHRSSIARQWESAAERLQLRLRPWDEAEGASPAGEAADGWLVSYQAAGRNRAQLLGALRERPMGRWLAIARGAPPGPGSGGAGGRGLGASFSQLTAGACLRLGSPAPPSAPTTWPSAPPGGCAGASATARSS